MPACDNDHAAAADTDVVPDLHKVVEARASANMRVVQ